MNIIFVLIFKLYKRFTKIENVGGIETNTNDVIQELRLRGHNLWIPEREPEEPEWVKRGEVDIITTSTYDPITYFLMARYISRFKKRAAVVKHAHTTLEDMVGNILPNKPMFNKILEGWLRLQYSPAHLLITPSNYSRQCLLKMQRSMTYPIHVVSNGIRLEKFKEEKGLDSNFRNYLKDKYGVPIDAIIILNVGLSWKKKGVDTFAQIAKALPNYFFVWVGPINKNPDIDEALKLKNVIFTGFYDDIREPYFGANAFLNTSRVENQGIPLIEAAICGLPVVAMDLPAYDWIDHGISCYKAEKVEDFIEGIEKIIKDEDYRKKMIKNARDTAIDLHDFNKIGDKVETLYLRAIKLKKAKDKIIDSR